VRVAKANACFITLANVTISSSIDCSQHIQDRQTHHSLCLKLALFCWAIKKGHTQCTKHSRLG